MLVHVTIASWTGNVMTNCLISNYLVGAYLEYCCLAALIHNYRPRNEAAVGYDFPYTTVIRRIRNF